MERSISTYSSGILFCFGRQKRTLPEHFRFYFCTQILFDIVIGLIAVFMALRPQDEANTSERVNRAPIILGWIIMIMSAIDVFVCCIGRAQIGAYVLGGKSPNEGFLQIAVTVSSILNGVFLISSITLAVLMFILGSKMIEEGNSDTSEHGSFNGLGVFMLSIGVGMVLTAIAYLSQMMQVCSLCKGIENIKNSGQMVSKEDYR